MYKMNYGQNAFILPYKVLNHLSDVDEETLRVLLFIASDLTLTEKPQQLAKLAGVDKKKLKEALLFWTKINVITSKEEQYEQEEQTNEEIEIQLPPKKRVQSLDASPCYTSLELGDLLEKRNELSVLINEVQELFGRLFNLQELNILVGMSDYKGLSIEYILTLCAYCNKIEKTDMRIVDKLCSEFINKGITDVQTLEEEIKRQENFHPFEQQLKSLFGFGKRTLTKKEKNLFEAWQSYEYPLEIIRIAYDITTDKLGEPSLPYMNSIIEKWHVEGLKTQKEIEDYIEQNKQKKKEKQTKTTFGDSIDTNEFFNAALNRSFPEKKDK